MIQKNTSKFYRSLYSPSVQNVILITELKIGVRVAALRQTAV